VFIGQELQDAVDKEFVTLGISFLPSSQVLGRHELILVEPVPVVYVFLGQNSHLL
tara:strand:+ start:5099 stop:5263 length:165 start_codon:yes stop_codon:yes gene_type:complete